MKEQSKTEKAFVKKNNQIVIEESIFTDIANGDKEAFASLYKATSTAVYAFLLSYVKNPEDAKDLMQDTYIKIRSAAGIYKPYGKPLAWIYTIAKNLALMKLRRDSAHPQQELEESSAIINNTASQAETHVLLKQALQVLSKEDYQIVTLHVISGMKHREIAELMDLSLTATLNRYNRALKKLKKQIGGEYHEVN